MGKHNQKPRAKKPPGGTPGGGLLQSIKDLNEMDVLLGRGTGPSEHKGNREFRYLIAKRTNTFNCTDNRLTKSRIAEQTVKDVKAKNGRFLRKLDESEYRIISDKTSALDLEDALYIEVDDVTAILKTKQAFRYCSRTTNTTGAAVSPTIAGTIPSRSRDPVAASKVQQDGNKKSFAMSLRGAACSPLLVERAEESVGNITSRRNVNHDSILSATTISSPRCLLDGIDSRPLEYVFMNQHHPRRPGGYILDPAVPALSRRHFHPSTAGCEDHHESAELLADDVIEEGVVEEDKKNQRQVLYDQLKIAEMEIKSAAILRRMLHNEVLAQQEQARLMTSLLAPSSRYFLGPAAHNSHLNTNTLFAKNGADPSSRSPLFSSCWEDEMMIRGTPMPPSLPHSNMMVSAGLEGEGPAQHGILAGGAGDYMIHGGLSHVGGRAAPAGDGRAGHHGGTELLLSLLDQQVRSSSAARMKRGCADRFDLPDILLQLRLSASPAAPPGAGESVLHPAYRRHDQQMEY